MSSKPTLRDIAEATGVSTASVSMILNGKSLERFSSQRVASVLAEAERIGYRTPSARCAGKQIAILSPSVSNPYHTMMISGIDAAASAAGYQTAIYNTYWNPRTESHLLDTLDFSRVAGIIFAMTPTQPAKVRELSHRVPIVAVGDRVVDFGIDTVDVDNFGAAQLVAKHLIGLGHKRIAYLSTALNEHHISRMRRAQGLQAIGRNSLNIFCIHTVELIAIPWYLFAAHFTDHPLRGMLLQNVIAFTSIGLMCALLNLRQ